MNILMGEYPFVEKLILNQSGEYRTQKVPLEKIQTLISYWFTNKKPNYKRITATLKVKSIVENNPEKYDSDYSVKYEVVDSKKETAILEKKARL